MEFRFRAKSGNKTFDEPSYVTIYWNIYIYRYGHSIQGWYVLYTCYTCILYQPGQLRIMPSKKSRLRNMSLAAFGARMPYDEALGSLVGAKKVDRNGQVWAKTSLIRCKFWNVSQVTSCFLGSVSALSIFKPLCVKSFSTEVFGLSIYVLTPSPNYAAAPPRFQEVWNSWLLGCGCLHPTWGWL